IAELRPYLPRRLVEILEKAMVKNRGSRYQSGEEMARDLEQFLGVFRPGYSQTHFARYMQKMFSQDMERELRALEGYVVETADLTEVGENLIADVLPADAPFTHFSPISTTGATDAGAPRPGGSETGETGPREPIDLHSEQTMLLKRIAAPPAAPSG